MTQRFNLSRILTAGPLWALAVILLCTMSSRAEDPPVRRHRMGNRFLFVIDTASAMKSRTNGIEQAVVGLLATDMKDELRKGDTIGLWTYSDALSTDFPMQVWSEAKKDDIINNVREHLHILVYEKRAHLENAWTAIQQVVNASERLTIILVYDGGELMKGTSLDKDINPQLKKFAREFRAAHQPFVLVLGARDGVIADYTINYPDSIVVPHMADPLPPPETNEPVVAVAPTPPPEHTNPPPPKVVINLTGADFPHHTYSIPQATNGILAVPAPAAGNVVAEATPAPVVSNTPAPVPAGPVAAKTETPSVQTNVAAAEPAPTPPPSSAGSTALQPASPTRADTNLGKPGTPDSGVASTSTPISPAAPAGVAPGATAASMQLAMMVIAFSLLTIAVALVILVVWRGRARSQPSLISQSLNRPH